MKFRINLFLTLLFLNFSIHSFSQVCLQNQNLNFENKNARILNKKLEVKNGIIQVYLYLEVDYKAFKLLNSSKASVQNYVNELVKKSNIHFNEYKVNLVVDSVFVWETIDPYFNFNENNDKGFALNQAMAVFIAKHKANQKHDLYYYLGGEDVFFGGVSQINVFQNWETIGFAGSNFYPTQFLEPSESDIMIFSHEIGHTFGLPHTHECKWGKNFDKQIDDCGNKAFADRSPEGKDCYNKEKEIIPVEGGTIMSYCQMVQNIGINLKLGFGQEPGERMFNILKTLRTDNVIEFKAEELNNLKIIYKALNGSQWKNNSGWVNFSKNINDWYGISINPLTNTISNINLNGNNLSGYLPEFNSLEFVNEIDLRNNKIEGDINQKFDKLQNLEKLLLSNNLLSGEINNLDLISQKITAIFFDHNNFSGKILNSIGRFKKLFWLNLGYNKFEGDINGEIGKLTDLRDLDLRNNLFAGKIPSVLGNLPLLQLGLSNNKLSGCFSKNHLNLCKKLTFVDIDRGNNFNSTWGSFCNSSSGICSNEDLDSDGVLSDLDCDDANPNINQNQKEILYNGIDDDCNKNTLDDDLDSDGFIRNIDCDDNNPKINPKAIEVSNNDVDEDCNGSDLRILALEKENDDYSIFPNPASKFVNIKLKNSKYFSLKLFDLSGKQLISKANCETLNIGEFNNGLYFLVIQDMDLKVLMIKKILKLD